MGALGHCSWFIQGLGFLFFSFLVKERLGLLLDEELSFIPFAIAIIWMQGWMIWAKALVVLSTQRYKGDSRVLSVYAVRYCVGIKNGTKTPPGITRCSLSWWQLLSENRWTSFWEIAKVLKDKKEETARESHGSSPILSWKLQAHRVMFESIGNKGFVALFFFPLGKRQQNQQFFDVKISKNQNQG